MLINGVFLFLKKKIYFFFCLLKIYCAKKHYYTFTLKILSVCLTRFKTENKNIRAIAINCYF